MREDDMPRGDRRLYSMEVQGFRLHDGTREDMRVAKVVAHSPAEAIAEARMLIAPDESEATYRWMVFSAVEIAPKEAREWDAWHSNAVSPAQNGARVD